MFPTEPGIARGPAMVNLDIATNRPTQFLQALHEGRGPDIQVGIIRRQPGEYGDAPNLLRLPPPRRQRPRCRPGATEEREEGAAVHGCAGHSITSSAMASSVGGMVMPSALAVDTLMTNSNLAARITGNSPTFSPLR